MMSTAIRHVDNAVGYSVDHSADDFNRAMKGSAFESHLDVIQLMINNGADEFRQRMESVASQGHIDIIRLIIVDHSAYNLISRVCIDSNLDVIKLMINHDADDFHQSMVSTIRPSSQEGSLRYSRLYDRSQHR